jgi:uncharacterized membrane-anchored protein
LLGSIFPSPLAAKVPEVILVFWIVKILTTAGGEATSDYLKTWGNIRGGATEIVLFVAGLVIQFSTRRYRAFAYWFLAYSIAIFGTGVSDFLHLDVGIPYAGTTLLWAVVLAVIFAIWYFSEGTLSIHSITTRHGTGGLHRHLTGAGLRGLEHPLRRGDIDSSPGLVASRPE